MFLWHRSRPKELLSSKPPAPIHKGGVKTHPPSFASKMTRRTLFRSWPKVKVLEVMILEMTLERVLKEL